MYGLAVGKPVFAVALRGGGDWRAGLQQGGEQHKTRAPLAMGSLAPANDMVEWGAKRSNGDAAAH